MASLCRSQASRMKGMDDVADGLHTTAHQLRNRLRRQPTGTRQHHVDTTQTEGLGGAPSRFSLQAFIIGQGSDIERWFHNLSVPWEAQLHNYSCGNALAQSRLPHLATAAAMNIDRLAAWLDGTPHAKTRISRFAALAT